MIGTDVQATPIHIGPNIFYRETRKPMLVFEFDGVLFKFSVSTPAFEPLFQLPPRMKPRSDRLLLISAPFLLYSAALAILLQKEIRPELYSRGRIP